MSTRPSKARTERTQEGQENRTPPRAAENGPRAILRALRVAEVLARSPEGETLAEIARRVEAPKSSLLAVLRSLVGFDYVIRDGERYRIGSALFGLATAVQARMSIIALARPIMQRLSTETGETVILASLDRDRREALYVDQIESASQVRFAAKVGDTRALYCSGAGRVLLAYQEEEWREAYYQTTTFPRITESTVTDLGELRRRVERARQEGFAASVEEMTDGGAGFAAPIVNRDGSVSHCLVLAIVASRVRQRGELFRDAVRSAAAQLSQNLGHEGPWPAD